MSTAQRPHLFDAAFGPCLRIDAGDAAALYAAAGQPARAHALLSASERAADTVSKRWTHEHRQAVMAEIALAERRFNDAMQLFRRSDLAADNLPVNTRATMSRHALEASPSLRRQRANDRPKVP